MSVVKNTKVEILIFVLIFVLILFSYDVDLVVKIFFERINYSPIISTSSLFGNIYLEKFFIKITELGNSAWYFCFVVFSLVVLIINKKLKFIKISDYDKAFNFFYFAFIYLIIVGLLTQIIKHLVGRPRPNHTNFDAEIEFSFFSFESNFHSFPSGHSSTIFMVCFILCAVIPRLKYFLFFFASVIALSRVVVNAHFFTDILAGMILALIVYKSLNTIFVNNYKKYSFNQITYFKNFNVLTLIIFLFIGCLFVSVGPSIDLYTAGLFFRGTPQFVLQESNIFSVLFRDILLPVILVYILILPIFSKYFQLNKIYFGYKFSFKDISFIWISQIITLLLFVNLILKSFWGRSRPEDVLQLGGINMFTPWYEFGDSCNTNCSFVSGDSSVGFSFIVLYLITRNNFYLYSCAIFGFLIGIIRILAGAHFLSDIFFAGMFVILLNLIMFKLYKNYYD